MARPVDPPTPVAHSDTSDEDAWADTVEDPSLQYLALESPLITATASPPPPPPHTFVVTGVRFVVTSPSSSLPAHS